MTLIELYDKTPLENIIGTLSLNPRKVFFVGTRQPMMTGTQQIKDTLAMKRIAVDIEMRIVDPADTHNTRKVLEDIVQNEPNCVFDMTGGDERLLLIAADIVKTYDLQSQYFHISSGIANDTDGDGKIVPTSVPTLTVKELITLHGGTVTKCTPSPACTKEEIAKLWNLTRHHPREWNGHLKFLSATEKGRCFHQTVSVSPKSLSIDSQKRYAHVRKKLRDIDIITNQSTSSEIRYTYNKPYYRAVLEKAGNILEYKTFYEAKRTFKNGKPLFREICVGVSIDWNNGVKDDQATTNNEIDLIAIHGIQPLFISCKNGDVDENELYKLNTVAERFGGEFARKMLIVTELEPDSPQAREALTRRAADMGIYLVANAGRLRPEEWSTEFIKAMGME